MSEEQQPTPALRLKPRLRPPDQPAPAVTPSGAPSETAPLSSAANPAPAASEPLAPRIQLKPRIEIAAEKEKPASPVIEGAAPSPPPPPAPPLFVTPPSVPQAVIPPLFVSDPPPAPAADAPVLFSDAPAAGAPGASDSKFKLKPKAPVPPPATPPPATVPPVVLAPAAPAATPPTPAIGAAPPAPAPVPAPGKEPPKTPPPFPVVAQPKSSKSNPPMPVPHVHVKASVLDVQPDAAPANASKKGARLAILGGVAVIVLGSAGFFAWKTFLRPAPPPVAARKTPAPGKSDVPSAKGTDAAKNPPTPSEALNKLAHAPAEAINKAQEALAARRASGQARVDAAADGIDLPDKPFGPPPAAPIKPGAPTTAKSTATTNVAPGLVATTQVDAAPEANPAFRSFVANAKVGGVFQGAPARIYINGRLLHAGETADSSLGIVFDGIDGDRHQLVFKDRSGATVLRKY